MQDLKEFRGATCREKFMEDYRLDDKESIDEMKGLQGLRVSSNGVGIYSRRAAMVGNGTVRTGLESNEVGKINLGRSHE